MIKLSGLNSDFKVTYEEAIPKFKGSRMTKRENKTEYEEIKGKHGYIYPHDDHRLAVSSEKPRVLNILYKLFDFSPCSINSPSAKSPIPGVERYTWCIILFPPEMLNDVAKIIKAKKKMRLSDSERERRRSQMKEIRLNSLIKVGV